VLIDCRRLPRPAKKHAGFIPLVQNKCAFFPKKHRLTRKMQITSRRTTGKNCVTIWRRSVKNRSNQFEFPVNDRTPDYLNVERSANVRRAFPATERRPADFFSKTFELKRTRRITAHFLPRNRCPGNTSFFLASRRERINKQNTSNRRIPQGDSVMLLGVCCRSSSWH
jgi:hypothetical protein